jgi:hypothetical protein
MDEGSGWKDVQIAEAFDCHFTTVENLRRRLVEQGLDAALEHGNSGVISTGSCWTWSALWKSVTQ